MLELIKERKIPKLLSREQMISAMLENVYGRLPQPPKEIRFEVKQNVIPDFCAGKAICNQVTAICRFESQTFSFPFHAILPTDHKKVPFFVHINFRSNLPDHYQPTEELIDNGFAVLTFNYNDITKDDEDFTDGLAGVLYPDGIRKKILMPGKSPCGHGRHNV